MTVVERRIKRAERRSLCGEREGGNVLEWRGREERTRLCEEREGGKYEERQE
jgi:hypothetical protein